MIADIGQPLADIHIRLFVGLILFLHHNLQSGITASCRNSSDSASDLVQRHIIKSHRQRLQRAANYSGVFVFIRVNLCRRQQFGFLQLSFNHFIFSYRDLRFKNLLVQPHAGFTFHIAKPTQNVSPVLIHPTRSKPYRR